MISLTGLAIFSGLSLNLLLQFAIGAKDAVSDGNSRTAARKEVPVIQILIIFIAVFFLWIFFNRIIPGFWKGFSEYFLYFPVSALVCLALELLGVKTIPKLYPKFRGMKKSFSAFTAYDGLVPAALIITSIASNSLSDVFILAFFFALGNLIAMMILNEIRRRSIMEWVPRYLRGSPLILISMGLLSLISSSAAGIFFKILETIQIR